MTQARQEDTFLCRPSARTGSKIFAWKYLTIIITENYLNLDDLENNFLINIDTAPDSSHGSERKIENNEADSDSNTESDPEVLVAVCVDHLDHSDEGDDEEECGEPEDKDWLVDDVVDCGDDVLAVDVVAHHDANTGQVGDTVPGSAGIHGHLGEQCHGDQGQHDEEQCHQTRHRHAGGAWGQELESGGLQDHDEKWGCCEERSHLNDKLVESTAGVGVGIVIVGAQGELKHHQAVVHQVDDEEGDDDDVGCGDSLAPQGEDVDTVAEDRDQHEDGEKDDPDETGVFTIAVAHIFKL